MSTRELADRARREALQRRREVQEKRPDTSRAMTEMNLANTAPRIGAQPDPDCVRIPEQLWIVYSYCTGLEDPSGRMIKNRLAIKIRGCFPDRLEAEKHAERVRQVDPDFHIYVGDCQGEWIILPHAERDLLGVPSKYYDQDLDNLMGQTYEQQKRNRERIEQRKKEAESKAARERKAAQERQRKAQERESLPSPASEA